MCLKTNGTRPTSASSAIRGGGTQRPAGGYPEKDVGASKEAHVPDAHRRQDGERVHGDEPWWHTESGYSYGLCPSGRARQQEGLGRDPLVSKKCKDLCKFYHRYSVINSCMHSKTRFQPRFVIDLFSIYEKSVHLPRVIKKDFKEGL